MPESRSCETGYKNEIHKYS